MFEEVKASMHRQKVPKHPDSNTALVTIAKGSWLLTAISTVGALGVDDPDPMV